MKFLNGSYKNKIHKLTEDKVRNTFLKAKERVELVDKNGDYTRFLNYFIKSLVNEIKV